MDDARIRNRSVRRAVFVYTLHCKSNTACTYILYVQYAFDSKDTDQCQDAKPRLSL